MTKAIRIFISSPSDVEVERHIALQVIRRLGNKFRNSLELKPVLWEREPLLASGHFQDALDPSTADLMVCILWSRLGSPLPNGFQTGGSSEVKTGTEWEFEKALEAYELNGRPDILVYRKSNRITEEITNKETVLLAIEQKEKLDQFFDKQFHNADEAKTFKRAYFNFEKVDEFENQLEIHIQNWIEVQLENLKREGHSSKTSDDLISWHEGSPFRGLEVFEQNHADIFFGRTAAVGQILAQFKDQVKAALPFTMILGMSGSGKSSLVNAGLLPLILQPRVIEFEVGHVEVLRLRPASLESYKSPLLGLCNLLADLINLNQSTQQNNIDPETLEEQITRSPKSLSLTFSNYNQTLCAQKGLHQSVRSKVLLMIDQFEELFTVKSYTADMQRAFCDAVEILVNTGEVWCLGTLRSDFVAETEGTKLVDLMRGQGQYTLQPPNVHELEQIILQPAKAAGLSYEEKTDGENLASTLRDAAQGQPGALPLLEFCLDQLFVHRDSQNTKLTFEAYERIGRLEGAIGKSAEKAIVELEQQGLSLNKALSKVFHRLISINPESEETATARFAQLDQFEEEKERKILDALINARLLVVGINDHARTVRIAHEALINNWERVRKWIHKDIEFLKWHARTEREFSIWEKEKKIKARLIPKGKPLIDAQEYLLTRKTDINLQVINYLNESLLISRRAKQKNWFFGLTALVFVFSGLFLYRDYIDVQTLMLSRQAEANRTDISGSFFSYAGSEGEIVSDIGRIKGHGLYTGELLVQLKIKEHSLSEAIIAAHKEVRKYGETRSIQTPQLTTSLNGDIYLHASPIGRITRAFVVGTGNYDISIKLPNAINDAKEIAKLLRSADVDVVELIDPSKQELDKQAAQFLESWENSPRETSFRSASFVPIFEGGFFKKVGFSVKEDNQSKKQIENSIAIIYFAGGGVEFNGNALFAAKDVSGHSQESIEAGEWFDVSDFERKLRATVAARVFILDFCRSNPFTGTR